MFSFLNPYVLLGGLAALILVGGSGYMKGRADSSAKYEYAAIKAERDELRLNAQVSDAARAADAKRMAQDADLLRDLQTKAEEDAKKLSDPNRVCLDADDNSSLRKHFRRKAT